MPFTIERDGVTSTRQIGGRRTLPELLTDDEWAAWRAGRLVALNAWGGVLPASSVLEPGARVVLREVDPQRDDASLGVPSGDGLVSLPEWRRRTKDR